MVKAKLFLGSFDRTHGIDSAHIAQWVARKTHKSVSYVNGIFISQAAMVDDNCYKAFGRTGFVAPEASFIAIV